MTDQRIAVVGPFTYFENHFPERWKTDRRVLCLDVNEADYSWLIQLHNFKPSITLFYRPELYPSRYIKTLGGVKVAFLSEPLPPIANGQLDVSAETKLRMRVYEKMTWDTYDWHIYYDAGKRASAESLGYRIDEYLPLPIDTHYFNSIGRSRRPRFDICFVGKATPHRIFKLNFLRSSWLRFLWIAHGCSGRLLASIFRHSSVVLNIHADDKEAFEPRIYLAASCGAIILSERLSSQPDFFKGRIFQDDKKDWNENIMREYLEIGEGQLYQHAQDTAALSTRVLLQRLLQKLTAREVLVRGRFR